MLGGGGGGAVLGLVVVDNGGQSIGDRYGAWPTVAVDALDVVVDPYTGEWVAVDPGLSVSDEVGDPFPYVGGVGKGDGTFTAYGTGGATKRRQGFDALDSTNHVGITLTEDAHTFVGRVTHDATPTNQCAVFGIDATDYRWGVIFSSADAVSLRVFNNATPIAEAVAAGAGAFGAGQTITVAGSQDSEATATSQLIAWEADGTEIDRGTDTYGGGVASLAGDYRIGRGRAGGDYTAAAPMRVFGGVDGLALSFADMETLEVALRSTQDADELALLSPISWVDGLSTGGYSRVATEVLATLSGAGSKPTVAPAPAVGPTYTQPQDFGSLIGDWDALRGASYDGSNLCDGVLDYSGNGRDMVCTHPTATQTPVTMLGRSVYLPSGVASGAGRFPAATFAETLGSFTLLLAIPTDGAPGGADYYFSLGAASLWSLRVGTPVASTSSIVLLNQASGQVGSPIPIGAHASANGSAAHALVLIRRDAAAGEVRISCWHDEDTGAGVVTEAAQTVADTFAASLAVTGASLLGRIGSATGTWAGPAGHRAVLLGESLADDDALAMVRGQAARLGWDPEAVAL